MSEQTIEPSEPTDPSGETWEQTDTLVRPKWPKVVGIISIILGSLGLVCGGLMTVWGTVAPGFVETALAEDGIPVPDGMKMHLMDYVIMLISLGLSLLLLFAGIAAVSYRPTTRVMHLIYGGASIPLTVWSYIHQSAKQANIADWANAYPDNEIAQQIQAQSNGGGQLIGLVIMLLLGFGIPLFYLIWFGLIKTKPEQITGGDEGVY